MAIRKELDSFQLFKAEYNEAEKAKIKKLLTAEQFTKWEQINAQRKEKAKQASAAKAQQK